MFRLPLFIITFSRFLTLVPVCVLGVITAPAMALGADPADEEFRIKKNYYSTRFDGYYEHYLRKDQSDELRQKGAVERKNERKKHAEAVERARREYIANRKSKPTQDFTRWEEEIKQRQLEKERQRKDYVRRQKDLSVFIKKYNYIPPEEELDIDVNYFNQ